MKIGILSRNENLYSTRRLVEAAKERGHEVHVIDHIKCTVVSDVGSPKIYHNGKELKGFDAMIPRIGASVTFYGTAVLRQFEMMKVFAANPSIAIVRSRDKLRSLQILTRHNVGIPKTVFANNPKDTDRITREIGGTPLVVKLLEGTQGVGVVLAETPQAAKSVIQAFYGLKASFFVQEFIKEAGGADIRAFVVDGKVIGAMKRQGAEGEFRSNLHRGGSSSKIRLSNEEKKTAIEAAKAMGLNVAGVDMLQSSRGPLILEVNSSPGLQGIEGATEIDVAGKIIEYLEKATTSKRKKVDKVGA